MVFWDCARAFPSLAHGFLKKMLEYYGVPAGLKNFVRDLYRNVVALYNTGGAFSICSRFDVVCYRVVPCL
eukprot:10703627-Karenia_brevis.AAC.1